MSGQFAAAGFDFTNDATLKGAIGGFFGNTHFNQFKGAYIQTVNPQIKSSSLASHKASVNKDIITVHMHQVVAEVYLRLQKSKVLNKADDALKDFAIE